MSDLNYELTSIKISSQKQKAIKKNIPMLQPLNVRHQNCNQKCQEFRPFQQCGLRLLGKNIEFESKLSQESCFQIAVEIIKKSRAIYNSNVKKKIRAVRNTLPSKVMTLRTYERIRNVIRQLKEQKFTNKAISGYLGLSLSQVQYIVANTNEQFLQKCYFNISRQHINLLKIQMKENNFSQLLNLKHLYLQFLKTFFIDESALSLSKFRKIVKYYAKCSYRLPIKRDIRASGRKLIEERFDYALFFITQIQRETIYVFLDETSLGHNKKIPKIWQRHDSLKVINYSQPNKTIGILGAISQDGYLAYQVLIGNVNGEVYAQHLIELYKNISNHYNRKDVIFILDHSKVHHSKVVFKILKVIPHQFLPPYTPQFNPIEKIWNCLKTYLNKQPQITSTGKQIEIHKFFNNVSIKQIKRTFFSIFQFVRKALKNEEF